MELVDWCGVNVTAVAVGGIAILDNRVKERLVIG